MKRKVLSLFLSLTVVLSALTLLPLTAAAVEAAAPTGGSVEASDTLLPLGTWMPNENGEWVYVPDSPTDTPPANTDAGTTPAPAADTTAGTTETVPQTAGEPISVFYLGMMLLSLAGIVALTIGLRRKHTA